MAEIPKDIIETQILPKVPPEYLPKFKSVCKSFNSLISNPKFISGRLVILNIVGDGFHVFDMDALESPPFFLRFPFPLPQPSRRQIHVFGSCNGLLCIGTNTNDLVLLNPSTRLFFNIPPLILAVPSYVHRNIGFGFDDLSNDFKIVIIVSSGMRDVSVYSLRTNSWKLIAPCSLHIHGSGALIDNHLLHWIFKEDDHQFTSSGNSRIGRINKIGCFDLRTEQWVENVALPLDYVDEFGCHRNCDTLGVFDGCLCLLTPSRLEPKLSEVDMWVMKEYGVRDSWVKMLGVFDSSVTSTLRMCPLGSRHGSINDPGEILITRGQRGSTLKEYVVLIWYNLKEKRSRLSQVHKIHGIPTQFLDVCICAKSLVRLPGSSRIRKEMPLL